MGLMAMMMICINQMRGKWISKTQESKWLDEDIPNSTQNVDECHVQEW